MAISRKVLVVQSWLTPHFVRNMHVSISVSYILCPSEQQNWLKSRFYAQMAQFGLYLGRNQWKKTKSSILTEITHFNCSNSPKLLKSIVSLSTSVKNVIYFHFRRPQILKGSIWALFWPKSMEKSQNHQY